MWRDFPWDERFRHRGERGKVGQKNCFVPYEKNIQGLKLLFMLLLFIYFEEFFHAFGLFILDAIELVKISKIFRNRKKGGGAIWDKVCPKWDKFY